MADTAWIKKHGKTAQGKTEYVTYLETRGKLSPGKAIRAHCYQCMNSYLDGRHDCQMSDCPLYPFMPYRKGKTMVKRVRSEKQMEHDRKLSILRSGANKIMCASK
ncbi:MAG: hypothetical protein A4E63_01266 [Syntrophorhabdus sp. PtaU1.Bin050]|nr:MAG: hypothetical protein A4E63_01266 [Syntrophorhabdus sp. PtaU1.Bin050]